MTQTNAASADEDEAFENAKRILNSKKGSFYPCLLYTSDAADE